MKIIFDRSIFHGNKFNKLKESNLLNLVEKGKIKVCFSTVFWEESLGALSSNLCKKNLKEQFDYLVSLDTGIWFKDIKEIIDLEFKKENSNEYYLFDSNFIKSKKEDFIDFLNDNVSSTDLNNAMQEKKFIDEKRKKHKELRKNFPAMKNVSFCDFVAKNRKQYIEKYVRPNHCPIPNDFIQGNSKDYVFAEAYLMAFMSLEYLAEFKKDKNDRADIEQLCFLEKTDAIVSDDKGIMKRAFDLLYKNNGKQFFESEQFLEFLSVK